jgi:hypothetical protein
LPTDPMPVPLAQELTALEAELGVRGYATALNHYRQAVDGLLHSKYESVIATCVLPLKILSHVWPKTTLVIDACSIPEQESPEQTRAARQSIT